MLSQKVPVLHYRLFFFFFFRSSHLPPFILFVSFSVQTIYLRIIVGIVGAHCLIVFAGSQRYASNAPVSWLLVLLFENKKNREIIEYNAAWQTFVHKLGMVQLSDDCFPFYCFFTEELSKQRAILKKALCKLKSLCPGAWKMSNVMSNSPPG